MHRVLVTARTDALGAMLETVTAPLRRESSAVAFRRGIRRQSELNATLSNLLPLWVRWLYLATNLPYLFLGWRLLFREGPALPGPVCGSSLVAGTLTLIAGVASILFHGTQCRCFTVSPEMVFAVPGAGWALKRATANVDSAYLEPSVFMNIVDIVCASSLGIFLFACNGGLRSADALAVAPPTLGLLVASAILKRRGNYRGYMVVHSVWHVAGAYVSTRVFRGELV